MRVLQLLAEVDVDRLAVAGITVQAGAGGVSIKTTSIYLTSDEQRQEDAVIRRERGRLPPDEDLDG
jgi:hypothetical protein